MSRFLLPAVLVVVVAQSAQASRVKTWYQNTPAAYEKAVFRSAVQSNEGALRLARHLRPLAGLDVTHVWDVVEATDGSLYVATGDDGKLLRVTPDGKVVVVHTAEDSQILCLALGSDGSVYAGTGPSGRVLRVDPQGKTSVWYETGETYVWSLAVEAKSQTVYAGTGPHGRIHKIGADGKGAVFFTSKQEHILCVTTAESTVYAGTDKGGLVYRIDARGKGFVLFQAPQPEVRRLLVADGVLYAGTSAPSRRSGAPTSTSTPDGAAVSVDDDGLTARAATPRPGDKTAADAGPMPKPTSEAKETKAAPAAAPSTPGSGDNSVFRIAADGTVRELFREKALVLSLLLQGNRLLVGTGMDGQLFEVDTVTREKTELARLDHGQILCLCPRRDGSIVLGTGDPGKLYVLGNHHAARGTITSEVLDAKWLSKWGRLEWQADLPAGTGVSLAVRSGNVAEPDDTWSDWSAEQTDPEKASCTAPPARFLQYRVTLTTDATSEARVTPSVRSVTLRYTTINLAPELTRIEVPDLNATTLENPKKLKFKWTATDANEDELTYAIWARKDGWKNWVLLEEELEKTEYEWDTTGTPSGIYQIKIVASDRRDNPEGEALTGDKVSAPFVVCHTPPTVTLKMVALEGDQAVIEATAASPLARLTNASFAVNGKKWANVFPAEGLFDSRTQTFRWRTDSLKPGTYVLVLKVRDAAGNLGSGDVVFSVPGR
jgi:hypothetical protein